MKVLAAAEGDAMCTNLIVENKVIGDTLVSFVGVYFRCIETGNVNHLSSMLDICEIIELSIHMEEQCGVIDASSKNRYQTLTIDFTQQQLQHYENVSASTGENIRGNDSGIAENVSLLHYFAGRYYTQCIAFSILQHILDLIPE
jgi:hypothetical protein